MTVMVSGGGTTRNNFMRHHRAIELMQLALVLVLAATLRVPNLHRQEIDEWETIETHEEGSIRKIFLAWRDHPCANIAAFASVKLARGLFGGEYPLWAGKLPSLAAGLGSVLLLYRIVRPFTSHVPALTAALLLAASKQHVLFSTSMRGYSFQVFGVLAMTYCFAKILDGRGRWWWAAYGGSVIFASWSHLWALLAMTGQAAYLVLMAWPRARKWLGGGPSPGTRLGLGIMAAAVVVVGCLFAPMWWDISGVAGGDPARTKGFYRSLLWAHRTNIEQVRPYLSDLLGWGLSAIVACGIVRGALKTRLGSLAACMLATLALILLVHPPGAFGSRYLLFLPAVSLMLVAACLQAMPRVVEWSGAAGPVHYLPRPVGDLAILVATGMVAVGLVAAMASPFELPKVFQELSCYQWPDYGAVFWVVVALQARFTPMTRRIVRVVGTVEGLYFATTWFAECLEGSALEVVQLCLSAVIVALFIPFFLRNAPRHLGDTQPPLPIQSVFFPGVSVPSTLIGWVFVGREDHANSLRARTMA